MTQTADAVRELIVDSFAGGGGASTGIEWALGRSPDIAINHSPEAIAMHQLNHPNTRHYCENVWKVDPIEATGGRPVGLAWFSPDCTHFSKAKGGKPKSKKIRGLAWVVKHWAKAVRPRLICLENVEEFADWGPLLPDGKPCPLRRGLTFRRWWRDLEKLGYELDARELKACDYGAPTSRKRLFIIARCDGQPIRWPEPTHGPGLLPYRTAAECIDWSIPCRSIFGREKDLAEATHRRIARGVMRYVVHARQPFLVAMEDRPAAVTLINTRNGEREGQAPRVYDICRPYPTVTAQGSQGALVAAFLARHYGGHGNDGADLRIPMPTITSKDHHALVAAFLMKYYGTDQDPRLTDPLHTITSKDRFGLVTVRGEPFRIVDIGMRMLQPRELFRAQGFPADVKLTGSKTSQVERCGNSVSPPIAAAIVRANMTDELVQAAAA
jgi:DNA (cytosine-5)-methyltransferase 1